jgi:hypothetical protein
MARFLVLAVLVVFLIVFLFLFVGVLVAAAQRVNPCTRIHVPRTAVTLFTTTDLSSKTATEGEEIQVRVDTEIRIDDCLLIAKGAAAHGRITAVQKSKSFSRSGKLAIGVESIQTACATDAGTLGITMDSYCKHGG